MRKDRTPLKSGDEQDWVCKAWRRVLCVFQNHTGLGKQVKRRINKRIRRKNKQEMRNETHSNSW